MPREKAWMNRKLRFHSPIRTCEGKLNGTTNISTHTFTTIYGDYYHIHLIKNFISHHRSVIYIQFSPPFFIPLPCKNEHRDEIKKSWADSFSLNVNLYLPSFSAIFSQCFINVTISKFKIRVDLLGAM